MDIYFIIFEVSNEDEIPVGWKVLPYRKSHKMDETRSRNKAIESKCSFNIFEFSSTFNVDFHVEWIVF